MNTLPSYTSSSARSDSGAGERDGRGTGDGDGVAPTQLHHRGGHVAQGAWPVDNYYYYYYHCWLRWLCCVGGGWKRERRHQIRQWINQISNGIDHALLLFWQIVKKQKTHSRPHLQRSFLRRLSPMEALASLDQKVPLLNQSDLRQKMNLKIMSIVFCHITKVCV